MELQRLPRRQSARSPRARVAAARRAAGRSGVVLAILLTAVAPGPLLAQAPVPELTAAVNDFANIIDPDDEATLDRMIRALQAATTDVVVVTTIDTFEPFGDIRSYAVEMFENHGKGIGVAGKDNGLLILLAVKERRVWIEVGYGLEEFVTDGFAGETSREDMVPHFRRGDYGAGLVSGTGRLIGRIAERRNVSLDGVALPQQRRAVGGSRGFSLPVALLIFILIMLLSGRMGRSRRALRRWGGGGWSGWSSGVGPFGGGSWGGRGGFGRGGFGGGGFGGGFGGFGGGRSGGGGGGAGW
jgi:uncharacterized protein